MPATGDRVPCVYVENHRVVGLNPKDPLAVSLSETVGNEPTGKEHPEYLKMGLSPGPMRSDNCQRHQSNRLYERRPLGMVGG